MLCKFIGAITKENGLFLVRWGKISRVRIRVLRSVPASWFSGITSFPFSENAQVSEMPILKFSLKKLNKIVFCALAMIFWLCLV